MSESILKPETAIAVVETISHSKMNARNYCLLGIVLYIGSFLLTNFFGALVFGNTRLFGEIHVQAYL